MSLRTRPIHCKFETVRLAGEYARTSNPYHRGAALAACEQLSARFTDANGRIARPATVFADFRA